MSPASRPTPLAILLLITFLGSLSSGTFWAAIFFITDRHYHFTPSRNLLLAAAMGAIYALGARYAGALLRAVEHRVSARAVLGTALSVWGLAALVPLALPHTQLALWGAALVGSAASAVTWPVVESFLAAGRHGAGMRSAIGWFNVTWTPATAVPLLLMQVIGGTDALHSLILSAVGNAGALLALLALPARPGRHEPEAALAEVGPEYPALLRSASWLLPLSYVMSATLAPVLPFRLASVGHGALPASVVAASWMLARFVVLALMWRVAFWHGRWGTLAAAAGALVSGLVLALLAQTLPLMVVGLLLFGTGMGLTYYASLYYALAVGHAAVDAGGNFEALIGLGYCVGPLLGLAGQASGGAAAGQATVTYVCALAALGGVAALRPYLEVRRQRRGTNAGAPRV